MTVQTGNWTRNNYLFLKNVMVPQMEPNHDSQICGEGFWSVNARVGINKCLLGMVFTNHQLVMKNIKKLRISQR